MPSRRVEDLNQVFQPMVRSLLEQGQKAISSTLWTLFITDGYRSLEEQTKLYNQGRTTPGNIVTNAKAGQSPHNHGLAIDVAFQRDGMLSYSPDLYKKVYPIAKALGFELGAEWSGFVDRPHLEHPKWESIIKGETTMPELMQIEKKDFEKLMREAGEKDKKIVELQDTIVRLEIDKKDSEQIIRELTLKLNKCVNSPVVEVIIKEFGIETGTKVSYNSDNKMMGYEKTYKPT